jgi:hypothetical protein
VRVPNKFCLQVESAYLTSVIAQYPNEAKATHTYHRSLHASGDPSAFHHHTTHTQCSVSNPVQLSLVSQMDYDSSTRCSLPPLTPLCDTFDMGSHLDMDSLYQSKIEPEDSWGYSSLSLSPDMTRTVDTLSGESEEFETWETRQTRRSI